MTKMVYIYQRFTEIYRFLIDVTNFFFLTASESTRVQHHQTGEFTPTGDWVYEHSSLKSS